MKVSIKNINTFGVDVSANEIFSFDSIAELKNRLLQNSDCWYMVGEGSNILFTKDFDGVIICSNMKNIVELPTTDKNIVRLKVDAGVKWDDLVDYCNMRGLWGVENLSAIPGTVGASPVQNIGAYGVEVADVITKVEYLDTLDMSLKNIKREDCDFGYRNSIFKGKLKGVAIITSVEYELRRNGSAKLEYGALKERVLELGEPTLANIRKAVVDIRDEKLPDPKVLGNGGSFFKNPVVSTQKYLNLKSDYPQIPSYTVEDGVKIPAAWLIEQSGWKGRRKGNVGVCKTQPLVLVNYGGGSGEEVYSLSEEVIKSVSEKFDIMLEREINIL